MRILFAPGLLLFLSGCAALAIPPALSIASYAGDGISYLATDKTISDHMLSDALGRNCATWRIFRGKDICKDYTPEEAAARAKARSEERYDEQRAQVAQIDGPFSASGAIEGAAIAQAPKKKAPKKETKSAASVGFTKVSREDLSATVTLADVNHGKSGGAAAMRGTVRGKPAILTGPTKANTKPNLVRLAALRRSAKPSRRAVSALQSVRRFIVFGSFRNKRAAARLARRHQVLDPFVVPARVRGKTYYRVVTRPEGRARIATAFRSLKRAGVRDAYTIRACRAGRVSARCLRQVPHQDGVSKKPIETLLTPRKSRPEPTASLADG